MRPSVGIGVLVCASTIVLAGIVAGSGCTVLTNDGLPDDAGKFDGETDGAVPVCGTCLAQECTGQWATCFGDPACVAAAKRASSATCVASDAGTEDGGTDPLALYAAFTSCNGAKASSGGACATDCSGATLPSACSSSDAGATDASDASDDGATTDASTDDAGDAATADAGDADAATDGGATPTAPTVDTCTACVSGECGDAKKACAIGSECAAYLECVFAAADAAAANECGAQHATGKAAATELATCTRVGCSNACGF